MKFLSKLLPVALLAAFAIIMPWIALGLLVIYLIYIYASFDEGQFHVRGAIKKVGSDTAVVYAEATEASEDVLLTTKEYDLEGRVAYQQSGKDYSDGFKDTYRKRTKEIRKERKESRDAKRTRIKDLEATLATIAEARAMVAEVSK